MGRWGSDDVQQQLSFANTRYNIRGFCGFAAAAAATAEESQAAKSQYTQCAKIKITTRRTHT